EADEVDPLRLQADFINTPRVLLLLLLSRHKGDLDFLLHRLSRGEIHRNPALRVEGHLGRLLHRLRRREIDQVLLWCHGLTLLRFPQKSCTPSRSPSSTRASPCPVPGNPPRP